ncbi:PEPxxWA-CTERM sorting domain-containing protein [Roseateles sp. UC29_93]|uniref:PEPxxWA-CTERM sorting domain-containing protein n=1 Tax=Roseateles sp. UC29_93 TaxID=3350177 RepID=UPI00366CF43D
MNKKIGELTLALAAVTSMAASPARAERFEATFTGTLTRMQSTVGCQDWERIVCASRQDLSPVAPITFTRSFVFEVGGPGMSTAVGTGVFEPSVDWYGRPMRYELGDQAMGSLTSSKPVSGALIPAGVLAHAQLTAPAAIDGSYVSTFHIRDISTYLDAAGGESRADLWGANESVGWTTASGQNVSLMFQFMQAMPFAVTQQNLSEAMSVSDFIARMNQDFWCQGCTQTLIVSATVAGGGTISDYLFHGSIGAFSVRQLGASAVPEPATYALMLAGVAVVGFAARRRKAV